MHQRYNGIPQFVMESPDLLELLRPAMRADVTVLDTYHYVEEPPLACSISVCGGDADPTVTPESLDAWRSQTTGRFQLRTFPGDHFYIQSAQTSLLQSLREELARYL